MRALLGNLLLALGWVGVSGELTFGNFALGLLLGLVALWLLGDIVGARTYVRRVRAGLRLLAVLSWQMLRANIRVTRDVLSPRLRVRPAVFAVELDASSPTELFLLALLTTLTPGTATVDVDRQRRRMYVYDMYGENVAAARAQIKQNFERCVLALTRGDLPDG